MSNKDAVIQEYFIEQMKYVMENGLDDFEIDDGVVGLLNRQNEKSGYKIILEALFKELIDSIWRDAEHKYKIFSRGGKGENQKHDTPPDGSRANKTT